PCGAADCILDELHATPAMSATTNPATPARTDDTKLRARASWWRPERRGLILVFAGLEGVALIHYLLAGRRLWFFLDEWDFLANRSVRPGDLLAPHGGHLV